MAWTKEQRAEAFKRYRVEQIDGKLYAVVTCDFGRGRSKVHVQDMYQRLASESDAPRKLWHGTTIAADHRFEERQRRLQELAELRSRQP